MTRPGVRLKRRTGRWCRDVCNRAICAQGCEAAAAEPAGSDPTPGRPFSRQRRSPARSGRFMYNATICGPFRQRGDPQTGVSSRHGLSPNAFQIRLTVGYRLCQGLARPRVDECVASRGFSVKVLTITTSTWSSVTVRGTPERCSSLVAQPLARTAFRRTPSPAGIPARPLHHLVASAFSRRPARSSIATPDSAGSMGAEPNGPACPARRHRVSEQLSVDRFEPCAPSIVA